MLDDVLTRYVRGLIKRAQWGPPVTVVIVTCPIEMYHHCVVTRVVERSHCYNGDCKMRICKEEICEDHQPLEVLRRSQDASGACFSSIRCFILLDLGVS
jgi:hypothetical protein